jgi:hypothetical protein
MVFGRVPRQRLLVYPVLNRKIPTDFTVGGDSLHLHPPE